MIGSISAAVLFVVETLPRKKDRAIKRVKGIRGDLREKYKKRIDAAGDMNNRMFEQLTTAIVALEKKSL